MRTTTLQIEIPDDAKARKFIADLLQSANIPPVQAIAIDYWIGELLACKAELEAEATTLKAVEAG